MRKLIAGIVLSGLSLVLTAIPGYAYCTADQVNQCNDKNNTCTSACNFAGAPQSCYANCVCQYDKCRMACGDISIPNCPVQTIPRDELTTGGGENLSSLFNLAVEVNASPKDCRLTAS